MGVGVAAVVLGGLRTPVRAAGGEVPDVAVELALDPLQRTVAAVAHLRLPADAREAAWILADSLTVTEVWADSRALMPARGRGRGGVRYTVRVPPGTGVLRIRYGGVLAALDASLDHREVLGGMAPFASEQGSFLPAGGGWYPRPAGLHTWTLQVTTPAGQRAVAAGDLVDEAAVAGGGMTARFERRQASEGIDLVAGPYAVAERWVSVTGGARVRLRTWFHAPLKDEAEDYLDATAAYVTRYSDSIGAFPYAAFHVASSPLPTGFGMAGLTWLGVEVLKLPFIRHTSLGHEVLHNWWGNGVFVDARGGNWCEGLTTYQADYAYKAERSRDEARAMRLGWLRDFAALAPGSERALASFTGRHHTASATVGYGKSAMLFHMLENEIGGERFRAALRGFWSAWRFREADFTALRQAFEQAAGRDLAAFFAQWLGRTGAPTLAVERAVARGNRLELDLVQTTAGPPYTLRVPLRVELASGSVDPVVVLERARQRLSLDLPAPARNLRIDPDFSLWRALAPGEAPPILRQFQTAPAPGLVVLTEEAAVREAALTLGRRVAEEAPRVLAENALAARRQALLVVGTAAQIEAAQSRYRLPARPAEVADSGAAAVWIAPQSAGALPLVFVSLPPQDAVASLQQLARRLPHLGASSWVRLREGKPLERGTWPGDTPVWPVAREG